MSSEQEEEAEEWKRRPSTLEASGCASDPYKLKPPKFTVDLSLSPEQRYLHIVPHFLHLIEPLPSLLDELYAFIPWVPNSLLRFLTKLLFHRVYDDEEQKEIEGIARAARIDLYLLVALNVFLDSFMGCTSGGVRVRQKGKRKDGTKMLHFRTLDWGMDPLRDLVIELDYVKEGKVVYSCITYFGYVGVLTGLKKGLSLALNFRPNHDKSTIRKRLSFKWHSAMILFGRRRGIASELRQIMLSQTPETPRSIAERLLKEHSTACYITLSDGQTTVVLDNDNCTGLIRQDPDFIVAVNHDVTAGQESWEMLYDKHFRSAGSEETHDITGMEYIVMSSTERQECVQDLWKKCRKTTKAKTRNREQTVVELNVIQWMSSCEQLSNEETHYGVIMDPTEGRFVWIERYPSPLEWYERTSKPIGRRRSSITIDKEK